MITEDYVSFEIAKLLKEKGFDANLFVCYTPDGLFSRSYGIKTYTNESEDSAVGCICPTLQIVMKWLREVHHYYIQVMLDSWALDSHTGYYVVIQKTDSEFEMMLSDVREQVFYDTPEEAAEDAIMYIIENLI